MYACVHKNVLRRTQKCTQAYTKMYSSVHKNVQRCTLKGIKYRLLIPVHFLFITRLNTL